MRRVKIGYSIDFDKIPKEISTLLTEYSDLITKKIPKHYSEAVNSLSENDVSDAIQKIEKIRDNLYEVDLRLEECGNILKGHQRSLLGLDSPQQRQQTLSTPLVETPVTPVNANLEHAPEQQEGLQNLVEQFREAVNQSMNNSDIPSSVVPPENVDKNVSQAMQYLEAMANNSANTHQEVLEND